MRPLQVVDPVGNYNTHSTTGSDGSYAFPHVAIGVPRASSANLHQPNNKSHDSTRLSLIAASATDLEARLPPVEGEQQRDQEQIIKFQTSSSQQPVLSKEPTLHSSSRDSQEPVEDLMSVRRLPPAPGPLPNRPRIKSKLVYSPSGHSRVPEKSHGRAQKVRGKFTDSRRQEVQEIRKKGACIRCRMLRKTVSIPWSPRFMNLFWLTQTSV